MRLLTIPLLLSLFSNILIVSGQTLPPEIQFVDDSIRVLESEGRDIEVCVELLDFAEQTVTASLEVIDTTSTATGMEKCFCIVVTYISLEKLE